MRLVVAIVAGAPNVGRARAELLAAGLAPWACDAIMRAPGWPSTEDDRLDVIASVAARLARGSRPITEADITRLRAVGFTDANLLDLAHTIARCAPIVA